MRAHASKDPQTLLTSAARTATNEMTFNTPCVGGAVYIYIAAVSGTPSLTFGIYGVDPVSAQENLILESSALSTTGLTVLRVHPSLTAAANTSAKDILPHAIKLRVTHGTADSCTYSVGFVGVGG